MIPKGLHCFVRLYATRVIGSARLHIVGILVVGEDGVYFMAIALVTELHHIMGGRGHGPVIVAEDTLVIVFQPLPTDFAEESVLGLDIRPSFGKAQIG